MNYLVILFFYSLLNINLFTFTDAPTPWQYGFQDPATPAMEGIILFHNHLMCFVMMVVTLVCYLLCACLYEYQIPIHKVDDICSDTTAATFSHISLLETVWTLFPTIILMVIAVPSFTLLYAIDETAVPRVTLKATGHQWFWSYESNGYYTSEENSNTLHAIRYDSFMVPTDVLYSEMQGNLRLLTVDNRIILPAGEHIRLLVTSADVIHSWAIPSFGVKIDAVPGRLNQVFLFIKRPGIFYGQCSEICGVNHGFMPIMVESIHSNYYIDWLSNFMRTRSRDI